ncbi:FAD binding domain protein [Ralstonia insidiosa]|uniref:FAD binding domain protein n=1 Tax=Ralstonia insidiosa TaxID=190721 RepID=A0AAC9BD64_9RALS|nr:MULTISPECIES: glycolate oxidase subunit GlcE [Ralstonia]ANH71580.1 FAD binding domain protein [Ralstonia insidiosa]EPX96618.1 FAD-binding protein [Ralstonia sp. AU12-08]MBY4706430.1 glycolate oxidase subunit GlcE [Ralstonia insidiosa]GAQ27477.1 glycolate oxidase FAD binding subunit [Ralstonia sp. NT80]
MSITPDTTLSPTLAHFRDAIAQAADSRTPLTLRGGGTKDFYGRAPAPQGTTLDTREWSGIVDYDCAELVITARSGTPLAEIEAALAEHKQMLAFEPPHFAADGKQATVGGAFASGLSGPRRQSVGALRDFVLGAVAMDGRGDLLNFGGQVMKNVAGYDVSRLMAGALGTLGLVVQVSLKVLPMPFCDATLRFALPQAEAIDTLNRWGGQPLPIAASAWIDGALWVRLSGADAAVRAAITKLGGERVDDAEAASFWRDLREQSHAFFARATQGSLPLWRIALPPATPPLALGHASADEQLVEWGGGQRWWIDTASTPADTIRDAANKAGGHATLFRNGDRASDVFTPVAAPLMAVHKRLKDSFDPHGIFNPGRLYADF